MIGDPPNARPMMPTESTPENPAPDSPQATQPGPDERALVQAVAAGNRKAIGELVERYSGVVYGFLSQRLDRRELADDLLQEVFLAAWKSIDRFRGDASLATWLCGIARNKVSDYYRGRLRELPFDEPGTEDAQPEALLAQHSDFEGEIDRTRTVAAIQETMSEMPELYRAALVWRYWDGCSASEMAEASGKTVKAIERILSRARAEFAQRWSVGRKTQGPGARMQAPYRLKHG